MFLYKYLSNTEKWVELGKQIGRSELLLEQQNERLRIYTQELIQHQLTQIELKMLQHKKKK